MARISSNSTQFVTPPPAQLYALTDTEDEDHWEKLRSFFSGLKYVFILTLMLWWLPVVGQCVAGYVGGRRAGSAYRGFLAAVLPILFFVLLSMFLSGDPIPRENPVISVVGTASPTISSLLPFLVPYMNFSALYLGDFLDALHKTALLEVTLYTVVIVFAFIGGLMADQTKREFRTLLKAVSPVHMKGGQEAWSKYYSKGSGPSLDSYNAVSARPAQRAPVKKATPTKKKTNKGKGSKKAGTI